MQGSIVSFFCKFLGEDTSKGESAESRGESAESVELQNKLIEAIAKLIDNQGSHAEMRGKMSTAGFDCEFFCNFSGEGKSKGDHDELTTFVGRPDNFAENKKSTSIVAVDATALSEQAVDKMIEKASIAEMRQCKMSSEGMDSSRMTSK